MKIGVLTSSRADFGIYLPLLKGMSKDSFFELEIIAFGTHLSNFHGHTIDEIKEHGFKVKYQIESILLTDSAEAIATSIGLTIIKFAEFWKQMQGHFDLVFCLGDRYEMFAAVTAGVPFAIRFAHFHGGEKTLGAIDNTFRHAITLCSQQHFVSTNKHKERVADLIGYEYQNNIYNVGALSLNEIKNEEFLSISEFYAKWGLDLTIPTILITYHPETIDINSVLIGSNEIVKTVMALIPKYQFLISMPNADTCGSQIRNTFEQAFKSERRVLMVENLGKTSYFTALKYASMLVGNSSSGIIEAASFGKFVINVGLRQYGRDSGDNILHVEVKKDAILEKVAYVEKVGLRYVGENIYYQEGSVIEIMNTLKKYTQNV